jgi:hypothetical protein
VAVNFVYCKTRLTSPQATFSFNLLYPDDVETSSALFSDVIEDLGFSLPSENDTASCFTWVSSFNNSENVEFLLNETAPDDSTFSITGLGSSFNETVSIELEDDFGNTMLQSVNVFMCQSILRDQNATQI